MSNPTKSGIGILDLYYLLKKPDKECPGTCFFSKNYMIHVLGKSKQRDFSLE
jgi:hypothetical protein